MWVKLGNSALINSRDFSSFRLARHDDESVIYGLLKNGSLPHVICSIVNGEEQIEHYFEQLQKAIMDRDKANQAMRKILWQPPD